MRKVPRRGLRLAKHQLLLLLLVGVLPPDVLADRSFRHTDRAHAVPTRPAFFEGLAASAESADKTGTDAAGCL